LKTDPNAIRVLGDLIEKHVRDWATCDGLSSQVIRKLIASDPQKAEEIKAWSPCSNDWKQRASCVSFVCLARHGQHNDLILQIAHEVIQNPARFPQLGTGWVLRELSLADQEAVIDFIKENYNRFSREGLRYAIEKMSKSLKQELLRYSNS